MDAQELIVDNFVSVQPVRKATWKQADPFSQLTVLLMSIDGHFSNYQCSVITREKFVARYKDHVADLVALTPFLEKGSW